MRNCSHTAQEYESSTDTFVCLRCGASEQHRSLVATLDTRPWWLRFLTPWTR